MTSFRTPRVALLASSIPVSLMFSGCGNSASDDSSGSLTTTGGTTGATTTTTTTATTGGTTGATDTTSSGGATVTTTAASTSTASGGTSSSTVTSTTGGSSSTTTSTDVGTCVSGLTKCNGQCLDLTGDDNNCGTCGNACPTEQTCSDSVCRCPVGTDTCSTSATALCQDDVSADVNNCGACGTVCPTGASCVDSACVCPDGQDPCSGACVDLTTDASNCGVCGTVCSGSTECLSGACVDPSSVTCSPNSKGTEYCTKDDSFLYSTKYWLNNNQWGSENGTGSTCIWSACQTGDLVAWGTSWSWTGDSSVKTFASLVYGWQWGWKMTDTGLPVTAPTSSTDTSTAVECGWAYTIASTTTGVYNVAYDIWLTSEAAPTSSSVPTEEIMIWLDASNASPLGDLQTSGISVGDTTWTLYYGNGGATWNVASYVRTNSATTQILDVMDFLRDLRGRSLMPTGTQYLASIQAGIEVTSGSGQIDTTGFYCRVQ